MLNGHHRGALRIVAATVALAVVFGVLMGMAEHCGTLHGIYCTTGFATTAGCDLQLQGWKAYALGEASMLLMVPLFAAVFSLFTAGLTSGQVEGTEKRIKSHVNGALKHHLKGAADEPPVRSA